MINLNKSSNKNIYCDVDETLIREVESHEEPDILIEYEGESIPRKINYKLVEKLKKKSKDTFIVVWTANNRGENWAKAVVNQLGLESYVDLALFKMTDIIDDSIINHWYINFEKPDW